MSEAVELPAGGPPLLQTRISGPNLRNSFSAASTATSSCKSMARAVALPLIWQTSAKAWSSRAVLRPPIMTLAFSSARHFAMARPRPLEPPKTNADLSESPRSMRAFQHLCELIGAGNRQRTCRANANKGCGLAVARHFRRGRMMVGQHFIRPYDRDYAID